LTHEMIAVRRHLPAVGAGNDWDSAVSVPTCFMKDLGIPASWAVKSGNSQLG
jgi:hypothetical protein